MAHIPNPVCVALDTADIARAAGLARKLGSHIGYVKVGMELFYAGGPQAYETIAREGVPVFLDLKLHDIPNTVAAGLRSLMKLDPRPAIINVHAAGGRDMLEAAVEALDGRARLMAVTVLTSLSDEDLWTVGFDGARNTGESAARLARLAHSAGLDGVVCSPQDVAGIKLVTSKNFLAVVPGIRPAEESSHDQKRIATPVEALRAGADILVIGRPITAAPDPENAVRDILANIEHAHAG